MKIALRDAGGQEAFEASDRYFYVSRIVYDEADPPSPPECQMWDAVMDFKVANDLSNPDYEYERFRAFLRECKRRGLKPTLSQILRAIS